MKASLYDYKILAHYFLSEQIFKHCHHNDSFKNLHKAHTNPTLSNLFD